MAKNEHIEEAAKALGLGATGKYPQGKGRPDDAVRLKVKTEPETVA